MAPIGIVIIDDHDIVRNGLRSILTPVSDISVLAIAKDGEEGLRLIDEHKPDVAVVDYQLPGKSGTEVCEELRERHPNIPVVMLTNWLDDEVIRNSLEAGARAYIYKDVAGSELIGAIRSVARGEAVLDPRVAGRVMNWAQRQRSDGKQTLSKNEIKILRLIVRGKNSKEAAYELGLSPHTVRSYLYRVQQKLNCETRAEVAAVASRLGLL